MIDTMKIYTGITEELYHNIARITDIAAKFNVKEDRILYKIISGSSSGSYDSNLHYRILECKFGFNYVLVLERQFSQIKAWL